MSFLFATTSISDSFGYLIDIVDDKGRHPVAYYSNLLDYDDSIYIIGSSFQQFMKNFLLDVDDAIKNSDGDFIVNIEKEGWPKEINHWLANDSVLAQKQSEIHETLSEENICRLM